MSSSSVFEVLVVERNADGGEAIVFGPKAIIAADSSAAVLVAGAGLKTDPMLTTVIVRPFK